MKTLKNLCIVIVLAMPAAPALANDLQCKFTTECLDTEACQDTLFEVTFGALDDRFLMSGMAGERAFVLLSDEDGHRAFVSDASNGAVGLMTLLSDGTATYSEVGLFDGGYAVRYHGVCAP
jgi:hypothetical protein